jgi:cytoskeleton protein RodZ
MIVNPGRMAFSGGDMATVAEQLRTAREAHRLSVYQVAETTKMRTDHVRALEEGNYDAFIAPVYIRGFVRTYAKLLRIDAAVILATLDAELAQTERFREHPSLTGPQKSPLDVLMLRLSRIPWRFVLPAAGVLLMVGIAVAIGRNVRQQRANDPLAGIEPGRYEPARPSGGETLPLPAPTTPRRPSGAR